MYLDDHPRAITHRFFTLFGLALILVFWQVQLLVIGRT